MLLQKSGSLKHACQAPWHTSPSMPSMMMGFAAYRYGTAIHGLRASLKAASYPFGKQILSAPSPRMSPANIA